MGNTTQLWGWRTDLAAFRQWADAWGWRTDLAAFRAAAGVWEWNEAISLFTMSYSTPTVSASNVSGSNSGSASSGLVTSNTPGTTAGGTNSGFLSYAWSYVSGDAGIACSNASAQNPTWSETLSGSSSAVWECTITDTQTGATSTVQITISLSYTQTEMPLAVSGSDATGDTVINFYMGTLCTDVSSSGGGCTPSGGSGSYTYSWAYVSGDAAISINSSTIQNPTWTKNICANAGNSPQTVTAVWQVSVRDSEGHGPVTANINVSLSLSILND